MSGIIWLASYPKSGNTWLRLLLRALNDDADASTLINTVDDATIASQREVFERVTGLVSSELLAEEAAALRPAVYRQLAKATAGPLLLKVHDRFESPAVGGLDFPADVTVAVVYLVRDPRDVCVSFAHHLGLSLDEMLSRMFKESLQLDAGDEPMPEQLPQWLGRWDRHVNGWLEQTEVPVSLIHYERLLADPVAELTSLLPQLKLSATTAQVESAVERCRFERLAEAERRHGFAERPQQSVRFFRSGKAGDWKNVLSALQVEQIEQEFASTMKRLGYDDGDPSAI